MTLFKEIFQIKTKHFVLILGKLLTEKEERIITQNQQNEGEQDTNASSSP